MSSDMCVDPNQKRKLALDFEPGPFDVLCARGKAAHEHIGNVRFRKLVHEHQEAYANALTKYDKSQIVSFITNSVRQASPEGGFVKLIKGTYYEVGDRAAKEKVGQTFRDLLHTKYTSSTKAKAQIRIKRRMEQSAAFKADNDSISDHTMTNMSQNSEVDDEDEASQEWKDSLNLILDLPFLVAKQNKTEKQGNFCGGTNTAMSQKMLHADSSNVNRTVETSQCFGTDINSGNHAPHEYLRDSIGPIRLQPSSYPNFCKEANKLAELGIGAEIRMNQACKLKGSSCLAVDHPSLFSTFSNNGAEVGKPFQTSMDCNATVADQQTFDSLSQVLNHPSTTFAPSDLEPVPLEEEAPLHNQNNNNMVQTNHANEWQAFFMKYGA